MKRLLARTRGVIWLTPVMDGYTLYVGIVVPVKKRGGDEMLC